MVYLFLADGFEEIEAITPIDILRRGGVDVKTAGLTEGSVRGAHGITVGADICIDDIIADDADMLILPGGMPGTANLKDSQKLAQLLVQAAEKNVYIAAICAAPSVLGRLGLLKGRRAVCFPGYEQELFGAIIEDTPVVADKNFITSRAAGTAAEFAFTLLGLLKGRQTAKSIKDGMHYA